MAEHHHYNTKSTTDRRPDNRLGQGYIGGYRGRGWGGYRGGWYGSGRVVGFGFGWYDPRCYGGGYYASYYDYGYYGDPYYGYDPYAYAPLGSYYRGGVVTSSRGRVYGRAPMRGVYAPAQVAISDGGWHSLGRGRATSSVEHGFDPITGQVIPQTNIDEAPAHTE